MWVQPSIPFYQTIYSHAGSALWPLDLHFVVESAILIANPRADSAHFSAFYFLGTTYAPQALWYSWMTDVTIHDLQLRAITTGFMSSFDFAFATWWPLIFYPVTDAPNYRKGYIASIVTGALIIPLVLLIAFLEKQAVKRKTSDMDSESDQADIQRSDEQEANFLTVEAPNKS